MARLAQAAAEGQDLEPLLAELRAQVLQGAPGQEEQIDAMIAGLRQQLAEGPRDGEP